MEGDLVLLVKTADPSEELRFLLTDSLNGNEMAWKLKEVEVSETHTSVSARDVACARVDGDGTQGGRSDIGQAPAVSALFLRFYHCTTRYFAIVQTTTQLTDGG